MRFGPYEVTGELGHGGAGVVYRARGLDGGEVAIKVLRATTADALVRFEREVRLQRQLGSEAGFVPVLEVGGGATPYVAMPLLEGGTLRRRLEAGPLPREEAVALAISLGEALGRAHALGVVHRDVKPENVLFDSSGRAFVADLGLAKHFTASAGASMKISVTVKGLLRGTAGYMAPEQAEDAKHVGAAADVFSLGAILYECLAGRPAFAGETLVEVLSKVAECRPEPLGAPSWLEAIVARALARDPEERFADGAAFARALAARSPRDAEPAPRTRALVIVGLTLVAAALGLVTWSLLDRPRPPRPLVDAKPAPSPRREAVDTKALLERAARLGEGRGVARDPVEALRLYREAAATGDPEAIWCLGAVYDGGLLSPKDPVAAAQCYRQAAEAGYVAAMGDYGAALAAGKGVPKDEAVGLLWIRRAAERGSANAMCSLGLAIAQGLGVAKDEPEGFRWLEKAADAGSVRALVALGCMLSRGQGVAVDSARAMSLFRKAALAGDSEGMAHLGLELQSAATAAEKEEAFRWLEKAVAAGEPVGMTGLGFAYSDGLGVARDDKEAARWFRKGAEAGEPIAMATLAIMLGSGRGGPVDEPASFDWARKAAEAGCARGMTVYARCFECGVGVAKDLAQATSWYRRAAALGDEPARDSLRRLGVD